MSTDTFVLTAMSRFIDCMRVLIQLEAGRVTLEEAMAITGWEEWRIAQERSVAETKVASLRLGVSSAPLWSPDLDELERQSA